MDLSTEPGTLPTHTTVGRPEPSPPSSARCQTESGGTILLQLLEFKTRLLEVVEELHIRRDAETRFEDQISTLVLEKQELEWEKESLQHQAETMSKQHTESLTSVKKQFQAKIRNIEEEKGKYQVSAELKDKEINNLKEELKALQLLKYNLEKKSSELEQKLALQSRSKDSHLNQLGEVEKRFGALSRQCAAVKQAHEKLEQNVDEAIKRNTKLTSANGKQEAALVSLKKELEEVSNKLIKAKMSSVSRDKTHSPAGGEQRVQQLQHKLNVESEMNKKLREENVCIRAEKQEVMRSLQHTQQLLLSQTQTVSRAELELQTQREQHEALKQEHEAMREKSTATEDKVAQLMESYAASKTSWDKEVEEKKAEFLGHIRSVQHDLRAVSEAHDELHHKHTKLSSQAEVQTQHTHELETRDGVSARLVPALLEEIREEETLNEPVSSSQPPGFDNGLRRLASAQTEKPDRLEDAGAATKLVATGSTGGRDTSDHRQQSQFKHPVNPSNALPSTCTDSSRHRLCALSRTTGNKQIINSNMSQNDPDVAPRLIHAASSVCDDSLPISKGSCVTDASSSSPGHRSVGGSVESKEKKDDMKRGENEREEEEMNVRGEDAKEGESAQTTDRADRREDAGDTKEPGTETKDRAERPHTPETQISAQTTADTATEKSGTQPVIDFMDADSPLTVCEPSDCSQSLSGRVCEKVSDCNHVNEVNTFCSGERQSVCQTFEFHQEKTSNTSAANIPTELSEPLNQSSICSSDTAAQSDNDVTIQELETKITRTQPCNPSEHEPQASPKSLEILELEPDATMDTVHLESEVETGSCQEHVMKKVEDAQTTQTDLRPSNKKDAPTEAGSTKCHKQCQVKEMLHEDTNESSPPGSKTFRSSFDWATVPTISEQHLSAPSSAIPSFLKRKHNKVPSVISRASDLLNASSRRHRQQGEQTATAAADVESRTSPSVSSFPVSTSSSVTVSRLSWQTTAGCSRALSSESDWEPSFSQEREEEQSSFRAQISKIEQFLNMEKLRLPKRPRTDD